MKASWINVLESGTVTVTSAATGFDAYRLYDRRGGLFWKATSAATQTIHVDQGASPVEVDALVIPAGHNLSGCTLAWERRADNDSWSSIVTGWTQSESGLILKQPASGVTYRYLRLVISGASAAPEVAEVWMGQLNLGSNPDFGAQYGIDPAVARSESPSKLPHYLKLGDAMRVFDGSVDLVDATELSALESWFAAWDGCRPFVFQDPSGTTYFAEFVRQPRPKQTTVGRYGYDLSIRQVF